MRNIFRTFYYYLTVDAYADRRFPEVEQITHPDSDRNGPPIGLIFRPVYENVG